METVRRGASESTVFGLKSIKKSTKVVKKRWRICSGTGGREFESRHFDQKAIEVLLRLNGFFDGTARRRTPPPYAKRMAAKVAQKNLRVDADLERKREFRVPPLRPIFVACETCVQAASKVANCCFVGAACCRACSAEFRVPPLRPIFVAGEGD